MTTNFMTNLVSGIMIDLFAVDMTDQDGDLIPDLDKLTFDRDDAAYIADWFADFYTDQKENVLTYQRATGTDMAGIVLHFLIDAYGLGDGFVPLGLVEEADREAADKLHEIARDNPLESHPVYYVPETHELALDR